MNKKGVSVLIIDDEREACANLEHILNEYIDSNIQIVGVSPNTYDAEKQISTLNPDAVFLDIEMPNENAFQFLERIAPFNFEVVFVTAYDEYAIKAFKLNAIDYILKPISIDELKNAVQKLKEKISYKKNKHIDAANISYADIANLVTNKTRQNKISLKDNNSLEIVDFKDIYFIEAHGSYSKVLFAKDKMVKEVIMSSSIAEYEELLPADLFFRIHKSYLINCMHVVKILKENINHVVIKDKYTLPVGRRRFLPLIEYLKSNKYYNG